MPSCAELPAGLAEFAQQVIKMVPYLLKL